MCTLRQRADAIARAIPLLEAQGQENEVQHVKWEIALFWLDRRQLGKEEAFGGRFGPRAQYSDGTEPPDPDLFTQEAMAYYENRLQQSSNPILLSWYADFLWEKKLHHSFAREAINSHHECYPIYVNEGWWGEAADAVVRSLRLALLTCPAFMYQSLCYFP